MDETRLMRRSSRDDYRTWYGCFVTAAAGADITLGIDREDVRSRASAESREINRRVVWAAYGKYVIPGSTVADKLQSSTSCSLSTST